MHQLQEHHWKVVKRILRYQAGTIHHGLLHCSSTSSISEFCDCNWRSNLDDRKSTTGYRA